MAVERGAGRRVQHGPATQREDALVLRERLRDRGGLEGSEVLLTGLHEDVGDGAALGRLDVGVGVADREPPRVGQQRSDGGLARAHRADEHDLGAGLAHRNLSVSR